MPEPHGTGNPWTVPTLVVGSVVVALIASFTVVVVTAEDPDVFLRFLAGPFLGNLGTFIVLIISAVLNRKVNQVQAQVDKVESNTNGTTTSLMRQNDQMTAHLMNNNTQEGQQ